MLNSEPLLGPQYYSGGYGFNNLESTIFQDPLAYSYQTNCNTNT